MILLEQLKEALRNGEAREAHWLSGTLVGRGMGTRTRHFGKLPEKRQPGRQSANLVKKVGPC